MANIYPHKKHGFQIQYTVYLPTGVRLKKYKTKKKRGAADTLLTEVNTLEILSRKNSLTKEEVKYYLNKKYINLEESQALSNSYITPYSTWDDLRIPFETGSRKTCNNVQSHITNMGLLEAVISWFKNEGIDPEAVTVEDVERFKEERSRRITKFNRTPSVRTMNYEMTTLRKLLDFIDPDNNPAREIRNDNPKKTEKQRKPLNPKEISILFERLEEKGSLLYGRVLPLANIALWTGVRPSELIRLKTTDIDLHNEKLYIAPGKTKMERYIDIAPPLIPYLKELMDATEKGGLLTGKKLYKDSFATVLTDTMKEVGLVGKTAYSLRHTFVTFLLKNTMHIIYVMEQAGHTDIRTTQRYLHFIKMPDSPMKKQQYIE